MAPIAATVQPTSSEALMAALQPKFPKNVSAPLSSGQLLLNALQPKAPAQQLSPAQALMIALKPKIAKQSISNICEELPPSDSTRKAEMSSKSLKNLLVIPQQPVLQFTPTKLTYSERTANISSKSDAAPTTVLKIVGKDSSSVTQKEKKSKLSKDKVRPKSRSNSEDAEFYAGSAMSNSPNPNAVPLPDFDENSDFFNSGTRYHVVENLDGSY